MSALTAAAAACDALLAAAAALPWRSLGAPPCELRLDLTLPTGQSFRWRRTAGGGFAGVIGRRVYALRPEASSAPGDTLWRCLSPGGSAADDEASLRSYLNLGEGGVSLRALHAGFSAADARFASLAPFVAGARVLRQDPLECLVSFVCSSNNHVSRIGGMVDRLCTAFGDPLVSAADAADSEAKQQQDEQEEQQQQQPAAPAAPFHAFPTAEALAAAPEAALRALGFGYRAPFVTGTAAALAARPGGARAWLQSLRSPSVSSPAAVAALSELPGVGPKVAACVALFSLDKHDCVPVDVHVLRLACAHYPECGRFAGKPASKAGLAAAAAALDARFGAHAGWAQTAMFVAELRGGDAAGLPWELRTPRAAKPKPKPKPRAAGKGDGAAAAPAADSGTIGTPPQPAPAPAVAAGRKRRLVAAG